MPNRWAVTNGNWSSAATWSGSLIPTASDDVFANNFTVNVDTSFQVLSLSNAASASAVVAGGSFNFNSGSISGSMTSATGIVPGATNLITVTAGSGTVTIDFSNPIQMPTISSIIGISHTGACNFSITAPSFLAMDTGLNILSNILINKTSTGQITINGNIVGGKTGNSGTAGVNALVSSAGNTVVNGDVFGNNGVIQNVGPHYAINQTSGILTINGNVTGGENNTDLYRAIIF